MTASENRPIVFALCDALLVATCLLVAWKMPTAGSGFHVFGYPLPTPGLAPLLSFLVCLGLLKIAFDPAARAIRACLRSPTPWADSVLTGAGGASIALRLWMRAEPSLSRGLILTGMLPRAAWHNARGELLGGVLVAEALWLGWSSQIARARGGSLAAALGSQSRLFALWALPVVALLVLPGTFAVDSEALFLLEVAVASSFVALQAAALPGRAVERAWPVPPQGLLLVAMALYAAIFTFLGIRKLDLYVGDGDFPVYLQPLWNTLHGHFMQINWMYTPPGKSMCWFSEHLDLIYLLLEPLYRLTQDPRAFVVLQALLIAFAAWPLFRIAERRLGDRTVALAFAVAYLANPMIARGLLFDFHAEAAEPLLIFSTFLVLDQRRLGMSLALSALLVSCKEDAALYLVAFGAFLWLGEGDRRWGWSWMALGVAWLLLAVGVLIPLFAGTGGFAYHTLARRYPLLGSDFHSLLTNLLFHPGLAAGLMTDSTALRGWSRLLIPLGALPILDWTGWIFILPPALEIFLTQFKLMKQIALHYAWFICPLYLLAAVVCLGRFAPSSGDRDRRFKRAAAAYLVVAGLLFHYGFDQQPPVTRTFNWYYANLGPLGGKFDWNYYHLNDHDRLAKQFLRTWVPEGAALLVDHRFSHDLANRAVLRPFRAGTDDVDFIFLDIYRPISAVTFRDLVMLKFEGLQHLADPAFGVRAFDEGYLLLARGDPLDRNLEVAREMVGFFDVEALACAIGEETSDGEAENKRALRVDSGRWPRGLIFETPAQWFPPGPIRMTLRVRAQGGPGAIGRLELRRAATGEVLAARSLEATELSRSDRYEEVTLTWESREAEPLSVTVLYEGRGDLWIDNLRWTSAALDWPALKENLLRQRRYAAGMRRAGKASGPTEIGTVM